MATTTGKKRGRPRGVPYLDDDVKLANITLLLANAQAKNPTDAIRKSGVTDKQATDRLRKKYKAQQNKPYRKADTHLAQPPTPLRIPTPYPLLGIEASNIARAVSQFGSVSPAILEKITQSAPAIALAMAHLSKSPLFSDQSPLQKWLQTSPLLGPSFQALLPPR